MKHSIGKNILLALLAVITVFSVFTVLDRGGQYIGKDYFKSDRFQNELVNFEQGLVPLIIATPDKNELIKNITVSMDDIQEHRYRYGDMQEQLDSIKSQYEGRTDEASIAARDKKIDDISKNFTDDKHIEEKIRKEKEMKIESYFKSIAREKSVFEKSYSDFVYDLKNVETNEHYTNGKMEAKNAFKKVYSGNSGYLHESRIYYSVGFSEYVENSFDTSYTAVTGETTTVKVEADTDMSDLLGDRLGRFEGTIAIPNASILNGARSSDYNAFIAQQRFFYAVSAIGLIAGIAFIVLWRKTKDSFRLVEVEETYRRLPIDVKLAVIMVIIVAAIGFISSLSSSAFYLYANYTLNNNHYFNFTSIIFNALCAIVLTLFALYQWKWLISNNRTVQSFLGEWENSLVYKWSLSLKGFFLKRSIGVQILVLLVVVFFWGFGTMLVFVAGAAILVWIPATLFIGIPVLVVLLSKTAYLNRLFVKTEEMARGVLRNEMEVKGKSVFADQAASLNALRDQMKSSHSEQAKSERLKTELITNVSHDLRTPLTSIITYTDLLKNPNVTDEERASYIAILDKKSMRLKTLIEDLFEVSKMASGNMELDRRKVDLTQLLQQAIAEHQEEIDKSGLDFRVTIGTKPIMSYVDGQKWWRVLDNLILNAIKYTLPGTRVYIALDEVDKEAIFVVKNITKYELGDDVDELAERFKRADTSRNTEGSGLGLAIAQSIVDLHGGILRVEVDGDLFKVTVKIGVI
ncbi:HAMP domain-containing sensor histidine kinase [Psychrobacillus sp.]|uniref:HAMP domain-containing sensor histidine kinase n=1 Tax=Psychrobacillus sp. TaxID=1871623 RepID=UPI0028BEB3A5|nr:HAMP domain-containing sensor histidine kinase [Psychrobacillus sp.]